MTLYQTKWLEYHTLYQTKWLENHTLYQTKWLENHTFFSSTFSYSQYREYPPGRPEVGGGGHHAEQLTKLSKISEDNPSHQTICPCANSPWWTNSSKICSHKVKTKKLLENKTVLVTASIPGADPGVVRSNPLK